MTLKTLAAAAALTMTLSASAHAATFIGDEANFVISAFGGTSIQTDVTTTITDPGIEAGFSTNTINFSASSLVIFYDLAGFVSVGGDITWDIFGLDTDDGSIITGVTLTSGLASDVSSISWTDDSISINILDLFSPPTTHTFAFDIETSISAVPVPASLPLLAVGLGCLGIARRKKRAA